MATDVARTGRASYRIGAVRTPTETKPFFLTSEFMVLALMTTCLFIASAVVDDVDWRLAWILGSSMVGGTSSAGGSPRQAREAGRVIHART